MIPQYNKRENSTLQYNIFMNNCHKSKNNLKFSNHKFKKSPYCINKRYNICKGNCHKMI